MNEEKKKNMADIAGSKKTIWHTSIVHRVSEKDAIIDGGTKDAAKALQVRIVRLNDRGMFAVEDGNEIIIVQIHEGVYGCACEKFSKSTSIHVLCKHLIHLKLLIEQKKIPQLWIDSPECEDMRKYLISTGWSIMDRMVYPHLDSPTADQPEVVKTLPPLNEDTSIDEATTLPPDEDSWKPDDEAKPAEEPKIITRRCSHCGYVAHGEDRDKVVKDIAEHRETCPDNPKNKKVPKQSAKPKVIKEPEAPKEKAQQKIYTCELCGTEHDTSDAALDCIERCKEKQEHVNIKALVETSNTEAGNWTDSQIEVMRNTVAAKATPEEFAYFLNVAKYSGLNPFLREIYFVKNDKGQTTIITGRDGYLTIAKRDLRFKGIHSMEVCENDEFCMGLKNGMIVVSKHNITDFNDRGKIIGAWACGHMDDQDPVTIFASMSEYDKSKNPKGGKIWKQYTSSMIRKVVESMVLKRIAGISGMVTDVEVGSTELVVANQED